MTTRIIIPRVAAFVVGAMAYLGSLVGCLGAETGSSLSTACGLIGEFLKSPMLYFLPFAQSRYFGIDAFVLFVVLNGIWWGAICTLVVWVTQRLRRRD